MTWSVPGYSVERLLGRGGSGEVWAGRDEATGEPVALKRMRPGAGVQEPGRLRREAALLAAFRHPSVIALRGVLSTADGLVLVLDLAAGGSLDGVLARRGRLRSGQAVALFVPLAEALAEAHAAGLVHGDVSPGNVLLGGDGEPLLADLGTARLAGDPGPSYGTAGYLDPEVQAGAAPTAASDVYGLAAVAARSLAGRPLAEPLNEVSDGGLQHWADHAHTLGVPSAVAVVICAALNRQARHRPTAEAFADQLRAACPSEPLGPLIGEDPARGGGLGQGADPASGAGHAGAHDPTGPDALTRPVRTAGPDGGRPGASPAGDRWAALRIADRRPARALLRWPARALARRLLLSAVVVAVAVVGGIAWAGLEPADPVERPRAATPDWPRVLARLDARRQLAFSRADAKVLGEVYATGSSPLAADVRAVSSLVAAHATAEDVRHQLRAVRMVAAGDRRAELEVTDRMPAYRVVGPRGAVLRAVPARGDRRFRVALVRGPAGWRILAIVELMAARSTAR